MKKEIIIVHNSEIVRRGLQSILRSYFNFEITLLSTLSDLKSFSQMSRRKIILFAQVQSAGELNFLHSIEKNNQVKLVVISGNEKTKLLPSAYHQIKLNTSGDKIYELVHGIADLEVANHDNENKNGELTQREREVLKLVATGNSNKEIADQLFISVHTVVSHRKNITDKLNIKSISGLTVYAIMNKIIDPDILDPENLI